VELDLDKGPKRSPSVWGRLFGRSPRWHIQLRDRRSEVLVSGESAPCVVSQDCLVTAKSGVFWGSLIPPRGRLGVLPRIVTAELNRLIGPVVTTDQESRAQLAGEREQ
jgi:hypothetical protein